MTTLDTIRRVTIQYQSLGADAVKRELDGVVAAQKAAASASDGASRSVLSLEKQIKSLERAYVPGVRAQQDFAKHSKTVSDALAQGSLSAERAAAIIAAMNARLVDTAAGQMNAARNTALNAGQMQNLGYQLNDVLTMLASGSSPFQVLATQGGQVYQVLSSSPAGVGGALKELGSRFLGLIGPVGLAGAGLVGAATLGYAAWSSFNSKVLETTIALNGAGRAAGVSVDALMAMSSRGAARGGISQAAGNSLGAGFASAGVGGSMIEDLIASTRAYSKAFGIELEDAGKELASAFADPSKGAEELNKRFGFLSADLQTQIQRQQAAGNLEGARQTLQEAYNRALAETTQRTSVLSSTFEALKNSASNAWAGIGAALDRALDPTTQQRIEAMRAQREAALAPPRVYGQQYAAPISPRLRGEFERKRAGYLADVAADIADQEFMQIRESAKALAAAMDKAANDLSIQATEVARRLVPGESRSALVDQRDLLSKAIGDPEVLKRMGVSAEQAREALARAQTALDSFRTPLQRMVEDGALAVAAASAFTATQRAIVEAERARIETLRSTNSETLAGVAAANAYKLAIAESTRALRDAVRSANDNAQLAGMNPFQRATRQIEIEARDLRERLVTGPMPGADPVAQAATRLANGFNSIFAEKIGQLQQQFPDLRMTSGVRTEEEQRTLRALYGPNAAAAPGNSRHEIGLAADFSGRNLSPEQRSAVIAAAQSMGLTVIPSNHGALHIEGPRSWAGQAGRASVPNANVDAQIAQFVRSKENERDQNFFGNVIKEANQEIEKQQALLDAQSATFGRSTAATVEAAKAQELLLNFERQGVSITPERLQQIDEVAKAYGRVAQSAEDARVSQQRTVQTLDAFREFGASAFSGVAMAIMQGKSASEAFSQALQRLAGRLFDILGNQLMAALLGPMGTGGGGALGGLLGGLFRGGAGAPMVLPSAFAVGGVVGAGGTPAGPMPLSLWDGAPHFAMGGGVGARPIIAHDGEIILNAAQQRNTAALLRNASAPANSNSRGGNTSVVVNNYSDAKVESRTSEDSDGNRLVEFVLTRVRQDYATGGFDGANKARFGRAPRGVAR